MCRYVHKNNVFLNFSSLSVLILDQSISVRESLIPTKREHENTEFFIFTLDCEWKIEKETRLGNDDDIVFTDDGLLGVWASLEDAKTSCLKTPECTGITNDDGLFLLRTSREKVKHSWVILNVLKSIK